MGNHKFLRKKIVSMTKVDIFSGFLGAGKTTLIKKLIAEAYAGEQLVLIENEFGEIGIDGGFLQDAGVNITEMNSGCICCSLVGDFGNALQKVLDQYHPDRILIEPSGVGKLSDVIRAVQNLHNAEIHLESFTTVVDAKKCKMYQKNFGEFFNNQIEHASCLILSHTAGLAESKLEDCVQRLRALNTTAPIVTTDWEQLSGEQLLAAMNQTETLDSALKNLLEETEHEHEHDHEHEHHHHDHDHDESCGCHDHDHHHDHDEHDHHHHDHDHDHEHDHGESCTCGCHDHDHDHEHHHHHHADEVFTSWGMETAKTYTAEEIQTALEQLEDAEKYGRTLLMQIIHKTDTWPPNAGDYQSCLVLYDDRWNDYCYMTTFHAVFCDLRASV